MLNTHNLNDLTQSTCHSIFFVLRMIDYASSENPSEQLINTTLILVAIILPTMVIKIQHEIKIYKTLGMLSQLVSRSIVKVLPFLFFFVIWTILFALELYVLGSNLDDVDGYKGTSKAIGYFILAFENGVGNISPPSVNEWYKKDLHQDLYRNNPQTYTESILVFLVHTSWFSNQFILLIVLLNFVIALISQFYEDVMNRRVMHR